MGIRKGCDVIFRFCLGGQEAGWGSVRQEMVGLVLQINLPNKTQVYPANLKQTVFCPCLCGQSNHSSVQCAESG